MKVENWHGKKDEGRFGAEKESGCSASIRVEPRKINLSSLTVVGKRMKGFFIFLQAAK